MNMKKLLALLLALLMVLSFAACQKEEAGEAEEEADYSFADGDQYEQIGGELNILNWGEYIDEELITLFEQETGVKVNYTELTSNEEMLIKLRAADSPYDLCFPSDYTIEKLLNEDLLQPLDMSKIPNAKNIQTRMLEVTNTFDPGNKYSLPYMWGTVGILYNTTMVDDVVDSWDILWNEKYAGQIWQYDSVRDAFAVSLLRLGYDMNSTNPDQIEAAKQELIKQIPLLKGLGTDNIRSSIINGKAALAVIYSGDAIMCMDENEDLAYVVPKEGSNLWFDNVVVLKNAKNVEAAHAFINFLNDGNLAARNTEYIGYSTPSQAAMDRLDEYYTKSDTFNPSDEILSRCGVYHDLGAFIEVYNKAWDEFKAAMGSNN